MNDFDEYVLRYCKKHKITPEEAKTHKLVQEVKQYYEEKEDGVHREENNNISDQKEIKTEEA